MIIRRLEASESDFLADMLYEAILIPEGSDPLPKEVIEDKALSKYIERWGKDKFDIALVMETGNPLVGAIWGRVLTNENKGFGYVDNHTAELSMAVKPEYRNRGIGTELIKAIAAEYQKLAWHICR